MATRKKLRKKKRIGDVAGKVYFRGHHNFEAIQVCSEFQLESP